MQYEILIQNENKKIQKEKIFEIDVQKQNGISAVDI